MIKYKFNNTQLLPGLPYLVFFLFTFIYFAFFADYVLFYQEKLSLFIFSSDFFLENFKQPGGFLIYAGKFFSAFFYSPVSGALVIAAVLTLCIFVISGILSTLGARDTLLFPFFIGILLFLFQADYRFLFYNNLGLLLQLSLFLIAIKHSARLKWWLIAIAIPLWYYLTGGFALLFSVLLTLHSLLNKEEKGWRRIIIIWGANIAAVYFLKEYIIFHSLKELLIYPFSESGTGPFKIGLLLVAGILCILPAIQIIKISSKKKINIKPFVKEIIGMTVLALFLGLAGIVQFDKKNKHYFHVEKLFYENKFDELIRYNISNPPTNSLTIFLNNVALCEMDKLDDFLFNFPQSPDGQTLFLKWEMFSEILKRGGYFYYTIGMPNEAHRWAFENMVMGGDSPEGVKMLIKTDMINGNYEVASKYILKLKKTLFYRKEARHFENLLYNDSAMESDPELGEKRRNRLQTDFFSITDDPYINIERILSVDSLNIKAYQYKIALMLLRKDFENIETELSKAQSYGLLKLPVNLEEAAVTLSAFNGGTMPNTGNINISSNTLVRWSEYMTVLKQYGNDPVKAEPALRREFGNTFWYWAMYR